MARLAQDKDHLLYPIETLLDNDNWAYLLSYSFQAPERSGEPNFIDSQDGDRGLENGKSAAADSVEVLDSLLDIRRDVLLNLKRANREKWERRVTELCAQMWQSTELFYSRKAASFLEIVLSSDMGRDPSLLVGRSNETLATVDEAVLVPWVFPTLPGTSPHIAWPDRLPELCRRLGELRPLALWTEPFDDAFEFQDAVCSFILQISDHAQKDTGELKEQMQLALLVLLNVTLSSGSYDRVVCFSTRR